MEKKFCEHLLEIGFIDSKTLSEIIALYNAKKDSVAKNNNQFNKKMTEILLLFFDSLTEIQKKYICFHLPAKFIKLIKLKIKTHLMNIIHEKQLKHKLILMKYLFRWYRYKNNFNNIKESKFDKQSENKNILKQGSFKFNKANGLKKKIICGTNNNIYNSIREFIDKTNNLNNSNIHAKNETKGNKNKNNDNNKKTKNDKNMYNKKNFGNFNINLNNEYINNFNNGQFLVQNKENAKKIYINNNQISNLMQNHTLINQKIKNFELINNEFIDSIESNENYISTNFNSANRYENNRKNQNAENYVIKTKNSKINGSNFNLFNTTNSTQNCNNKKIINIKPRNENNIYNLIYCNNYNNLNNNNYIENNNKDLNLFTEKTPFCERKIQTIESIRNQKSSPGKRLYEQGLKKLKNKKIMKNNYPEQTPNSSGRPKSVDYKYINSLYKNKKRSKTFEKVKNKVEKEEGLTFHPEINKDNYTDRINSNFLERNYSSPRNGKNMNEYTEKIKSGYSSKSKKMNKKEKEKIVKGMINRLYKDKIRDENDDNSLFCKKYLLKGMKTSNYLKGYKKKI